MFMKTSKKANIKYNLCIFNKMIKINGHRQHSFINIMVL